MKRRSLAILFFVLCVSACQLGQAQQTFWQRVKLDIKRMRCWPEPFQQADRQVTRDPFVIMKDNGWRIHNTLSDHFFQKDEQTLTRPGELKVRWIVTQAPMARRTVYVLRGETPEITQIRLSSVQDFLTRITPEGVQPEVLLTDIVPPEGSGEYFDAIDRQFKSSVPTPRLAPSNGGTSASGAASGS
jgi:hypothetical protein